MNNMKIENLKEGMVIHNYKELCVLLGLKETKSMNSRNAQFKELARYVLFHKEKQKIIIDEIYKEVKDKMDNRGKSKGSRDNNSATYIEYIEKLILDLLVQNEHKEKVCLSKNKLFQELKMTNGNYSFCKQRIPKLSIFMGIEEDTIEEWYTSTDTTLKSNLEKALDNLRKQSLIIWSSEISVCKIDVIEKDIYNINKKVTLDKYDEEIVTFNVKAGFVHNFRETTDSEKKFILHTEREVMREMDFDNKQNIVRCGMWETFKNKINKIILKELNIDYYFDSYKILFNEDHIYEKYEELLDLLLSEEEREIHKQELNKAINERIFGNVVKKQNRAIEETSSCFGEIKDDKLKRRINENYLNSNQALINNLIDKNSKDIKKSVKTIKVKNHHS